MGERMIDDFIDYASTEALEGALEGILTELGQRAMVSHHLLAFEDEEPGDGSLIMAIDHKREVNIGRWSAPTKSFVSKEGTVETARRPGYLVDWVPVP